MSWIPFMGFSRNSKLWEVNLSKIFGLELRAKLDLPFNGIRCTYLRPEVLFSSVPYGSSCFSILICDPLPSRFLIFLVSFDSRSKLIVGNAMTPFLFYDMDLPSEPLFFIDKVELRLGSIRKYLFKSDNSTREAVRFIFT